MSVNACHSLKIRVLVITHLQLIGGTPSHHKFQKEPKRTAYSSCLALLSDFLCIGIYIQIGYSSYSIEASTTDLWLDGFAARLEAFVEHGYVKNCTMLRDMTLTRRSS